MEPRAEHRAVGRLLASLLDRPRLLILSYSDAGGEGAYSMSLQGDDPADRKSVSRPTLLGVLEAITGNEGERWCSKCEKDRPESFFSKEARYCKPCERARVAEYDRRTKG